MTDKYIVPDFETVSLCDLKVAGAWRYAEDITTEVLCLRWTWSDKPGVGLWHPGLPFPAELQQALDDGYMFVAHNTGFEKAIWRLHMMPVYGWPDIKNNHWDDTLARCANLVIPHGLEDAVRILRLPALKDTDGSSLTIGLSKPDRKGNLPKITPEILARVYEYCGDDCKAQQGLRERIGTLSPQERQVWLLDQRINERGVRLDMNLVRAMQSVVAGGTAPLLKEFFQITGIPKLGSPKLKVWCQQRGVMIPDLKKETIAELLDADEEEWDANASNVGDGDWEDKAPVEIPADVRRALEIKALVGSASVKKLPRMVACVNSDGRIRGSLQYHGAGPGLWAGRLFQPQNFPRGTMRVNWEMKDGVRVPALDKHGKERWIVPDVNVTVAALRTGDAAHVQQVIGAPVETVVSALRHTIIPTEGRELVVGDFAGVQARLVLAGAGQHDKTALMASGADAYIDVACDIFRMPKPAWDDKEALKDFKEQHNEKRQTGKNTILGLGFQMGAAKFRLRYAKDQPKEFAQRVVDTYRKEWAPEVPKFWYALDDAAMRTVHERTPHEAYGVLYKLEDMWLTARLPSGRKLYYFNPQPIRKRMPWSTDDAPDIRRAWTYQARKMGVMRTIDAFGGLLAENYASGLARDLLVYAMFQCEREGLPIVLTVHDEIIADALPANDNAAKLKQIMENRPKWAVDIQAPIAAETWSGDRYKKG